jgi:hypothetical protein
MGRLRDIAWTVREVLFRRPKGFWRYRLAERLTARIDPEYKFSEHGRTYLRDQEFLDWYRIHVSNTTYRCLDRKYTVDQLMRLVVGLEGDTAECGVYKGAMSWLMCQRIRGTGKRHHAFDSFAGLSTPSSDDGAYWQAGDMSMAESQARDCLREFDFVDFHTGWIPERFGEVADRKFSFVHIDVDLYQPTYDSLAFFYERLVPGGLIVCDDYGFTNCPGAKRAFDEFFADKPEPVLLLTTGQSVVFRQAASATS